MKFNIIITASKLFVFFICTISFILAQNSLGKAEGLTAVSVFGMAVMGGYALNGWKQYNDRKKQN